MTLSNNRKFQQYQVVRIRGFGPQADVEPNEFDLRAPQIGDIATIVEVYENPAGYELECSDANGITQWLRAFYLDEIDFELVSGNPSA